MPEEKVYFKARGQTLGIPISEVEAFKKDVPDAVEVQIFTAKNPQGKLDTLGIPKSEVENFLKDVPDAKPLVLGKPSPVTQPGGGGGLPLNGTPGMDGGRSPFGMGSIAGQIGQPPKVQQPIPPDTTLPYKGVDTGMGQLPAMTAPEEEMQLPPMEQALGGGDKNAMMPGVGIENLTPPTQEQLTSADPFLGWDQKKKEIAKIEDPAKRNFKMGQQYERMAQAKQIENMDLEPMLMQGRHALESQYAALEALTQRINQTQDPNERYQLEATYNEVGRSFEDARSEYDELYKRYQDNAKFAATMLKGSGQLGGSELSGLESAGMGVVDLGTSMLKSLGAAISGVDYITTLGQDGGYLKPLGEAIEGIADRQMEKSKATKEKHSKDIQKDVFEDLNWDNGSYLAGQLIGSILLTVGGGAAAGVRGGQAVAASQVYGDAVQKGRDAGLSEGGSMLFALPVTLAAAYFSDKGVEAMAGLLKGSSSAAIKSAVQSLGTKPTAAKILEASTRFVKNTVSGGLKEGSQESAEFATEFGSKLVADQAGAEFKGEQLNMNEFLKGMQQNFVVGALGGTAFGGVFGESPANKISGIATKAANDPKFEQKFLRDLQTFEDAGDITPEQKQEAMEYYQKAKTAASQVSPTVTNPEQASRATELIMEQEDLTAQIQQTNPAMVAPLHSKLDEVNAELGDIAIASMADIGQISEPTDAKPKKIKTIAEIVAETKEKAARGERLQAAKAAFKEQQKKGEALRIKKEEDAKAEIKAQRQARDNEVAEIEKIRPDLTDEDMLLATMPPIVEKTIDRMDAQIPTDPTQVQESIDVLDNKFDELEAYKKDPKRTHTIEQIDEVIDLLGEAKTELQLYQEQLAGYERETSTTATEPTSQGKPEIEVTQTPAPAEQVAGAEEVKPEVGSVAGGDVEATTKALEEVAKKKPNASITFINKQGYEQKVNLNDTYELTQPEEAGLKGETIKGFRNQNNTGVIPFSEVSEAYHKAKSDGTNPELVKAVEQSLASQSKAEVTPEVVEEAVVEPVVEQPENKQPETAEKTLDDQKSKNKVSEETLNEQSNTEQDAEKIEVLTDETVDVPNKTIIAFHATPTGEVKSGKEAGIHIGTEKAAEQVKEGRNLGKGQVVPVSVKINKPLVLSDMPTWSSINLLSQLYNPSEGKYFGFSREQIQQVRDSDLTEKQKQQWVIDALKRKGFDAIAYKNDSEDAGKYSYVIFDEGNIELLNSNDESKTEQVQPVLEGVRDGGNQAEGRQEGQAEEVTGLDAIAEEFGNAINEVEKAKSQEQKNAESEKMAQASLPFQEQAAEEARQEPMAEEDAGDMIGDVFSMLGEDEDADTPKPSSSQNLYAIHPSVGRMMQPPPPAPTSIFPPQVQERINNARKKPKENPFYKILDKIRAFGNYFARTNVELSGKQFAVVIDKLRLIKAAPQAAIRAANLHMRKILSGLNDTQRAHFQDYILAADLLGSIEDGTYATDLNWAGRKGPFGFNNFQEVRDSFANGEALLAADPKLLAAVQLRDRNINALFELSKKAGLVNGDQINNGRSYFHRQVLKYMEDGTLADAVMKSSARRKKLAQFKKRQGSLSDYYTNFAEVEFGIVANAVFEIAKRQYVNDIAKLYKPIHKQMLADAEKEVQDFIDSVESQFGTGSPEHTSALTSKKELEAKAFNNLMGDKYKLYFPDGKNSFFRSDVVLGTDVQDAIARMVAGQTGLGIQDLNDAMKPVVMLTKGRQMFLPVEVADVFDRLGNVKYSHAGMELAADVIAGWTTAFKKVALLMPNRLLKYIGGNFAGDFDKSLATSPQIIARSVEMAKLYWDIKNGKDNKFFNLAVKLGIVGSGSSAEIGDVSKEEWAKFATTRNPSLEGFLKNAMENMGGVKWSVEKYFELAGKAASAREDIFRLAAFSVALEKVNKGDKFYWFSRKTEIDQMPNNEEKAAKLAREIFGDYGAVSQGGEAMAKYLMPFYRFRETNIRGYKNFIFNNLDSKAGREKIVAYGIKRGVTKAATMAIVNAIRLATFTAMVEIWNKMMFPDEEEELRDGGDQSFHIITGRNPDGTIQVYRTQGTLNAFMESMGITGVMQFYRDYENKDATMQDVAREPAKAFTNEMYQQMSPFVKIPLELSAKKSRFPNVFKPRTIRQSEGWMLEHTLSSLALREPYEMLTDKPRRNKSISDIFLTSEMNPNQIAYYQSLNKISEDMGRFESFFTGGESIASKIKIKRQDAMHRWSMNSKFGNIEDAEKDLANYYALGGTPQSLEQSVKAKNPLNSYPKFIKVAIAELISNKQLVFKKRAGPKSDRITVSINHAIYSPTAEEVEYVKSLSKKDIKMFEMAMKYYEQSIKNPYENLKKQGHAKKK